MNHREASGSSGRRGSRDRRGSRGRSTEFGNMVYRPKSQNPATVDRSFDEYSGNMGRGSRGRGRCTSSWSTRNSSGYVHDEQGQVQTYVKKSSQVTNVDRNSKSDGICSTKQPDESAALKFFGDSKDLLQLSTSSSSENINRSECSFVSRECEVKDGPRCEDKETNLVNHVKDVALSSQDSMSSTNCQKIERSSVMDRVDGRNSSNDMNRKPFDLFLRKKVMGLKPPLLQLNRDKRNAAKGYTGIVIRPGMVLLKNYLSISDQVMILNKCRQLGLGEGGFYQPGYQDGAFLLLKMMCLGKNWDPETSRYGETRPVDKSTPPKIPVEFSQFVENAIKASRSLAAIDSKKGEDEIPFMLPDVCIVNFYTTTGRLGLHQDKDESQNSIQKGLPVVSFSIGDSADFLYGDRRDNDKAENVVLESGDVLLFGGKSRNVFHGVRTIHKDTAPTVLVQETGLRPGRLNLTFRQY